MLNKKLSAMYPNAKALKNDLANILRKLNFSNDKATHYADRIEVDASKGAGHA